MYWFGLFKNSTGQNDPCSNPAMLLYICLRFYSNVLWKPANAHVWEMGLLHNATGTSPRTDAPLQHFKSNNHNV